MGAPFFWRLWHSMQAMLSSFLAFAKFGTRKGLLRYRICVPCSKRLPMVRDAFSEALRAQNRLLVYRLKRRNAAPALRLVILRKTAICMLLLLPLNSRSQLWAATKPLQTTASRCKSPQTVMDSRKLPLNCRSQLWTTSDYRQLR